MRTACLKHQIVWIGHAHGYAGNRRKQASVMYLLLRRHSIMPWRNGMMGRPKQTGSRMGEAAGEESYEEKSHAVTCESALEIVIPFKRLKLAASHITLPCRQFGLVACT